MSRKERFYQKTLFYSQIIQGQKTGEKREKNGKNEIKKRENGVLCENYIIIENEGMRV